MRLYTTNANDWTAHHPLIVQEAGRIKGSGILDAEVVCLSKDGTVDFDKLHSRIHDQRAVAIAFDLLMLDGNDLRRKPRLSSARRPFARVALMPYRASETSCGKIIPPP